MSFCDVLPHVPAPTTRFALHDLSTSLTLPYCRAEYAWPLLLIAVPNWWLTAYPRAAAALAMNQQRLVTAYDIYATLRHVATIPFTEPQAGASLDGGKQPFDRADSHWRWSPGAQQLEDAAKATKELEQAPVAESVR